MSLFEDTYLTIQEEAEGVFKDRGSKFIAYAYPLNDEKSIKDVLIKLRDDHPKARHFCYAYRLTVDRSVFRVNDDGEPSGSAGRPILNVLLSKDLTNIFVVVVRYFGGTLLGVPGLINAYKEATIDALNNAIIVEKTVNDVYELKFEYLELNDVMKIIKDEQISVLNQLFDLDCSMQIELRKNDVNHVIEKLAKVDKIRITYLFTR